MNYPSKPWTNGQTTELVPGETYEYDSVNAVWNHVTKATLDSDYQVDKTVIEGNISTNSSDISTLQGEMSAAQSDISTLQSQVTLLDSMSDSDAARIETNISRINAAYSMMDSDAIDIAQLKVDLEAEIAATNSDVTSIEGDITTLQSDVSTLQSTIESSANHDSDIAVVESAVSNLAMPVISSSQPTGKAGLLWVNLNDGKLYYWDASQEVFTEVVSGA